MNKLEINSVLDRADYFADLDPLKIIKTLNGYVILNVFLKIRQGLEYLLNWQEDV